MKQKAHVSKRKIASVKELSELVKSKNTILVASIKSMPAAQFQQVGKKLRGKAIIKVPKKNLIFRAIDSANNESLKSLKEKIKEDSAILFSDFDAFDLSSDLAENKTKIRAKSGQEAPEDISIEAGPTELMPGPALTELASAGLRTQIEKGKISIKESKVIVKKGEKISDAAAKVMSLLDIKPFSVGFAPVAAFDIKENKLYLNIQIDKQGTVTELKNSYGKSLAFAVQMNYISNDTIKFLLSKAAMNEKALSNFISSSAKTETPAIENAPEENKIQEEK
ncbi:50S ribosomal protein L10 [Candidatus Pacearchaeota archaeon]|nr:50S ribosomal protein L10 [Candidatus Pacearchaeota archaeon]